MRRFLITVALALLVAAEAHAQGNSSAPPFAFRGLPVAQFACVGQVVRAYFADPIQLSLVSSSTRNISASGAQFDSFVMQPGIYLMQFVTALGGGVVGNGATIPSRPLLNLNNANVGYLTSPSMVQISIPNTVVQITDVPVPPDSDLIGPCTLLVIELQ
jgi:hypothetical protein